MRKEASARKIALSALLILMLVLSVVQVLVRNSTAWSNGGFSADPEAPDYGTHDWIAQHALDWLPPAEKQYILSNLAVYLYGTELPDNNLASDGIGDTVLHHIYYYSDEGLQDDAAAARASEEYANALYYLKHDNLVQAAKTAGIMSHYIVDVAVFGHVMGAGTDWSEELHHSDYETFVNQRTSAYNGEFDSYLTFDGSLNVISAYDAALDLAYDTTFDLDGDFTCKWMDDNYDVSNSIFKNRAGESLNLAANLLANVLHTLYQEAIAAQPKPWGDWAHYHNYTEIVSTLMYLNTTYSNIVDVFSIGKSWLNQNIYCMRLTNETSLLPKPKLLFVGYHHARERITAELTLYFAVQTALGYGVNATITRMLNFSEIFLVVALDVDGFEAVEQNEWHRKNLHPFDEDSDGLVDEDPPDDQDGDGYIENLQQWNGAEWEVLRWEGVDDDVDGSLNEDWIGGVDLNRNYGYQWDAPVDSGSSDPEAEDFRGPAPFSEPETQALRNLALQHGFRYAISFHSGAESIDYPWDYTAAAAPHKSTLQEIASELSQLTHAPYAQSGAWYTLSGSWDDWMYGNRSTFAFTCEIYTNEGALQYEPGPLPSQRWEKRGFEFFNPQPAGIETVVERWFPVFYNLANRAIAASDASPPVTGADYDGSWHSTNFVITLIATDDFSGVAETCYRINDGAVKKVSSDGQPEISVEGAANRLEYWSIDTIGTEETPHNVLTGIKLDKTNPVITIASPTMSQEIRSSSATTSYTGSDEPSGISYFEAKCDGGAWINMTASTTHTFTGLADGGHTISVRAVDRAGNVVQESVDFVVNTSPLLGPGYVEEAIVVAVVVAAVIAVVYFFKVRRH
jgi:hypothetical protein